jgi:hypothetical protein
MKWKTVLVSIVCASLLAGCASVIRPPRGGGVQMGTTGDAWFAKTRYIMGSLQVSSRVYYCDGGGTCRTAQIR